MDLNSAISASLNIAIFFSSAEALRASYVRSSNMEDAHKLKGHLLLIIGELDKNVDPATTMQVVGALQKAGKAFEFMPIIGAGHGAAETPYGSRIRMEFLVKHLKP